MGKTSGDFLADVKHQHSEWVNKPSNFNTSTFIADMINLYMNYNSTGEWYNKGANHNKVLVDLATALKQEHANNNKSPGIPIRSATKTPVIEPVNSTVPPAWTFNSAEKTPTCPNTGAKYKWYKLHGRKNEKDVQNGIYMPHKHNHEEWYARRAKYNDGWKENHQAMKKRKVEANAADPPKKSAGENLSLAKIFKSTLSTQLKLSDHESNQLMDNVRNVKPNKDDKIKD